MTWCVSAAEPPAGRRVPAWRGSPARAAAAGCYFAPLYFFKSSSRSAAVLMESEYK